MFLVLIAGIRRHQIVLFTVYHGRQGSKAALIIMCMWAALKFKLFCIVHTASRCLSSGLFICLRRFLILLVCKNFTASHESCGLCMTTPRGSLCDPVWRFTDPKWGSGCIIPAEIDQKLTEHWLSAQLNEWISNCLWLSGKVIISRDHTRYTGYVWTLNTSFMWVFHLVLCDFKVV